MKPHLRKIHGAWWCIADMILGTGSTPEMAYIDWRWRHKRRTLPRWLRW